MSIGNWRSRPRCHVIRNGQREMRTQPRRLDLTGCSLLAVFAHPDDESLACGGLLAWCADLGADVALLCITRGQHGPGESRGLGVARETELRAAAGTLGVEPVVVLGYEDGMLPWVEASQLESDVRDVIQRCRPNVVVTFGEDGLYWHPDHVAVHERTTAAVTSLGDKAPALYYVTLPAGRMRDVVEHVEKVMSLSDDPPRQILGVEDVDAFGSFTLAPTLIIDSGNYATRKLAAIRCHTSQLPHNALAHVADEDAARLLGLELYRRATVGWQGDTFIEQLASTPLR